MIQRYNNAYQLKQNRSDVGTFERLLTEQSGVNTLTDNAYNTLTLDHSQALEFVYFIRQSASDYVKIGIADDLDQRLSQLQVGNPVPLIVERYLVMNTKVEAEQLEKALHRLFYMKRVQGEWFLLTPEDIGSYIDSARLVTQHADKLQYEYKTQPPQRRIAIYENTALHRAKLLLIANPNWMNRTTRNLASETGISRTIWSVARRAILTETTIIEVSQ